jgi:hypothetical protein
VNWGRKGQGSNGTGALAFGEIWLVRRGSWHRARSPPSATSSTTACSPPPRKAASTERSGEPSGQPVGNSIRQHNESTGRSPLKEVKNRRAVRRSETGARIPAGPSLAGEGRGSLSRVSFSFPHRESCILGPVCASPSDTRGRSRVPELGSLGSVRGALSNERPYREHRPESLSKTRERF